MPGSARSGGSARDKRSAGSRSGSASQHSTARGEAKSEAKRSEAKKKEFLVDRTVIDEPLIRENYREFQLSLHDPSSVPALRDIDLTTVVELPLSYQNIYRIDNLLGFERLKKLQLDNNIIEK